MERPLADLDAEKHVIGAMILTTDAIVHARSSLQASDFFSERHQTLCKAIYALWSENKEIDFLVLRDALGPEISKAGGETYLSEINADVFTDAYIEEHCKIVKRKSLLRAAMTVSRKISLMVEGGEEADKILDFIRDQSFTIDTRPTGLRSMNQIVKEMVDSLDKEREGLITSFHSGMKDFDEFTLGFLPQDLIIIAGEPGAGKTAFVNTCIHNNRDKVIAFFSLEMSGQRLARRFVSMESGISVHNLHGKYLSNAEWPRIQTAIGPVSSSKTFICDDGFQSPNTILSKSQRLKNRHGLDLVIVDNIQISDAEGKQENRTNEIEKITKGLKQSAKRLDVPVLAISHLTKAAYQEGAKASKGQLRGSGSILQDADMVFCLLNDPSDDDVKLAEFWKFRDGPCNKNVKLAWKKEQTMFADFDPQNFKPIESQYDVRYP